MTIILFKKDKTRLEHVIEETQAPEYVTVDGIKYEFQFLDKKFRPVYIQAKTESRINE